MPQSDRFDFIIRAQDEASAIIDSITGRIGKMVAVGATVATIAGALKSVVTAAAEADRVWNALGAAVNRHGGSWAATEKQFKAFASSLQEQTGLSDEAIARSSQILIDFGMSFTQTMDTVRVASDFAAGAGIGLETAVELLGKAYAGSTALLSRYGIILDESIPKAERFKEALAQMSERFGGAAAAEMETYAGKVRLLSEQFGDLKENIGTLMLPALTAATSALNDMFTVINSNQSTLFKLRIITGLFTGDMRKLAEAQADLAVSAAVVRKEQELEAERMKDVYGPTRKEYEEGLRADEEAAKRATEALEKLNEALWKQKTLLMQGGDIFGGLAGARGQITAFETAVADYEHFLKLQQGNVNFGAEGPTSSIWEHEEEAQRDALNAMQENQRAALALIERMNQRTVDAIVDLFMEGRVRLADVFKGMARDFISYFLAQLAGRLSAKLFATIVGATVGIATGNPAAGAIAAGGVSTGIGDFEVPTEVYGKRVAPPASQPAAVVVLTPVSVTQEFVRQHVIPGWRAFKRQEQLSNGNRGKADSDP